MPAATTASNKVGCLPRPRPRGRPRTGLGLLAGVEKRGEHDARPSSSMMIMLARRIMMIRRRERQGDRLKPAGAAWRPKESRV
eukprot:scaffold1947_cov207-Prasinococcus_capsulatus_cf.AAC.16